MAVFTYASLPSCFIPHPRGAVLQTHIGCVQCSMSVQWWLGGYDR